MIRELTAYVSNARSFLNTVARDLTNVLRERVGKVAGNARFIVMLLFINCKYDK